MWDRTFGGNQADTLFAINQTSDGGYMLGGFSDSDISGNKSQSRKGLSDYWVIRLDSLGNKLWDKVYGGINQDVLYTIRQTTDGGTILGGYSSSPNNMPGSDITQNPKGMMDYWIVKIDANGNKQWDKMIGGNGGDKLFDLHHTMDKGYILGGKSFSDAVGDKSEGRRGNVGYSHDYWIVKLDSSGLKQWDKTLGGPSDDEFVSVKQTPDGGYLVGGQTDSGIGGEKSEASKGLTDIWIVKINATGSKVWDKTIGTATPDELRNIEPTIDGGYILGGNSSAGVSGDKSQAAYGGTDFWLIKLGADITGIYENHYNINLTISPNPSQGKFQLQLNNLNSKTAEITVSDLLGRTVYKQQTSVMNNQLLQEINLPEGKGMYLLQVKSGNQTTTRKIIVQ